MNFRERKPYWVVLDGGDLTSSNKFLRLITQVFVYK